MSWEKEYTSSVEDYLCLTDRYELRFEYIDGTIQLRDGTPVLLLGGVSSVETRPQTALVLVSDVTREEAAQLAAFVASLRQKHD